ncbi:DNA methylase [Thalassoglobus neptunius]|uniref:site-specific DNA-methyltransferase (cytosine-N(4)-specific) n=2 Tax=Thalassoglobus neptunius TaxID=1938619 RepID=A0A5C5X3K9_9PLAN|nr:DNA methylase [Thalassoglobus neptunius]
MGTMTVSPKVNSSTRDSAGRWYQFYAMFSDEFAIQAIEQASLAANSTILDPWLGVGTTASAAVSMGHRIVGADINPVAMVISRGRFATRDALLMKASAISDWILNEPGDSIRNSSDPLSAWFHHAPAKTLRLWQKKITNDIPLDELSPEQCFMLTTLFEVAASLSQPASRSKNPTWRKRPNPDERVKSSKKAVCNMVLQCAEKRVLKLSDATSQSKHHLMVADSRCLPIQPDSIDFVLTSPPYCTRIDYAITTRVESAVLGVDDQLLRDVRERSMGTSTIRGQIQCAEATWGEECSSLMDKVSSHPSRHSQTYYLKTFLQYFSDLQKSLSDVDRCLKPNGKAAIVVQDSYYKELHIDLPKILEQMASFLSWEHTQTQSFPVHRSMRSLNAKSRKYRTNARTTESVLWFRKSSLKD